MHEIIPPSQPGPRVLWRKTPFSARLYDRVAPHGFTIERLLDLYRADLPHDFDRVGIVLVNDEPVPRGWWSRVRPKCSATVSFAIRLGDNVNIVTIATLAVLVAATVVSMGALSPLLGASFAAGATGAKLAGLGIAVIGTLAISALTPPPVIPQAAPKAQGSPDALGTASLQGNLLGPGAPVSRVMGFMRVFPPLAMEPLTDIVAEKEVASAVYILADAHELSEPKLGEVLVADLQNTEIELIEGDETDTTIALVTKYGKTENIGQQLTKTKIDQDSLGRTIEDQANPFNSISKPLGMASLQSPNEFWITIDLPTGLSMPAAVNAYSAIPFRIQFWRDGDTTRRQLPEFHIAGLKNEPQRKIAKVIFGNSPGAITPRERRGFVLAMVDVPMRLETRFGDVGTPNNNNDGDSTTTSTKGVSADMYAGATFTAAAGISDAPRMVNRVEMWPRSGGGVGTGFSNTVANLTLELFWKDGTAPANSTDGTVAQTVTITDGITRTAPVVFNSFGEITHAHFWVRIRPTAGGTSAWAILELRIFGDWKYSLKAPDRFRNVANFFDAHANFTEGNGNVRNVNLGDDSIDFYLDVATYPPDVYHFEIKRGYQYQVSALDLNISTGQYTINTGAGSTAGILADLFSYIARDPGSGVEFQTTTDYDNFAGEAAVLRYASVRYGSPVTGSGFAKMAVKTTQPADRFSILAGGKVWRWGGSSFNSWGASQNPADHFYDVLTGSGNKRRLVAPFDVLVDVPSISAFWTECNSKGYRINAVFEGRNVREAMRIAAACGYGIERESDQFGVITGRDRAAESVIQSFTYRNVRGARVEKNFLDPLPTGFRIPFINEDKNYQPDEIIIVRPGATDTGLYETVNYEGLTKEEENRERAIFDWRQSLYGSLTHHMEAPTQWLKAIKGDTCALAFDNLQADAGSAYVESVTTSGGNVTGLVLDGTIHTAGSMGVFIRCHDGTTLTKAVNAAGQTRTITFTTPFANPGTSVLDQGCLVLSGAFSSIPRRAILNAATPKDGANATLVLVDDISSLLFGPPVIDFAGFNEAASPSSPHTFTAQAIGAASANALLVMHTAIGAGAVTISGVNVNGSPATLVPNTDGTTPPGNNRMWTFPRPATGTTANIQLTFTGGSPTRAHLGVYVVRRPGSFTPYAAATSTESGAGTDTAVSIAVPRRGVAIVGAFFNGTNTVTWTNATERVDDQNSTDRNTSADFSNTGAAITSRTFTATQGASTTERRIAAVSFR
jgi:hypothetical protein